MAKLTKIKQESQNRDKKKEERNRKKVKKIMELHEGQRGKKQMSWRTVRNQPRKDILLGTRHLILRMA